MQFYETLNQINIMADKKALGRPKRAPAQKQSETHKLDVTEIKDQIDAKTDQSIDEAKETEKSIVANKEKVIEVKTEKVQRSKMTVPERKSNIFEVFVKGKSRMISRQAYEAVSKDPRLNVTLPKGSALAVKLDSKGKPCKDC